MGRQLGSGTCTRLAVAVEVTSSPQIPSRCVQPVEHRGGRPSSPQTRRQSKRFLFAHGPPTSTEVSSPPRVPASKCRRDVATARHPLPSRDTLNPPGHLPRDRPTATPNSGAREVSASTRGPAAISLFGPHWPSLNKRLQRATPSERLPTHSRRSRPFPYNATTPHYGGAVAEGSTLSDSS